MKQLLSSTNSRFRTQTLKSSRILVLIASVHNLGDHNSLSNIAKTIDSFKQTLESECKVAIKWFHAKKMIVNF